MNLRVCMIFLQISGNLFNIKIFIKTFLKDFISEKQFLNKFTRYQNQDCIPLNVAQMSTLNFLKNV